MAAKLSKAAHTPGLLLSPVCGLAGVGVGAAEAAGEDGTAVCSGEGLGTDCSSTVYDTVGLAKGCAAPWTPLESTGVKTALLLVYRPA